MIQIQTVQDFLQNGVETALKSLQTDTRPTWGSMEAQEMVEHLAMTVKGLYGLEYSANKEVKPQQEQAKERILYQDEPLPKGIPSPFHRNGKPAYLYLNLEDAKQNLLAQIKNMYDFLAIPENQHKFFYHPFLGKLNLEELQRFNAKHIRHHFEQFAILA